MNELAKANHFAEGQLSGPFGPEFSHYGPVPRLVWWLRFRPALIGFAAGSAACLAGFVL